jgi:hypothetical protein
LIADRGGAYISPAFEAVCARLAIDHQTMISTPGESDMNLMEAHFNLQRRVYDYQFSRSHPPAEWEQALRRSSGSTTPRRIKASSTRV